MTPRLHNFFRSSTSTRPRAMLKLEGVSCDGIPCVLREDDKRTPDCPVPTPELIDGTALTQSLAIIECLNETPPGPALQQAAALGRLRHGDRPGLADLCLYARASNNRRSSIPLAPWPTNARTRPDLNGIPALADPDPPRQPDAAQSSAFKEEDHGQRHAT